MSDDQIANALGQIMGKMDILHAEFRDYRADHADRHDRIDDIIVEHAADINQAKGEKAGVQKGVAVEKARTAAAKENQAKGAAIEKARPFWKR